MADVHAHLMTSPHSDKAWSPFPYGATVGELFFIASMLGLTGWWVYFWSQEYPRIRTETGLVKAAALSP